MNSRITIPLVLALCSVVMAEDQPVPPPPPSTDPTAPKPVVAPTADAPPAPAVTEVTPAKEPPPAPAPLVRGDRAAAAAGRAAAQDRSKPISLRLEVDGGYDSNILREDTSSPTATDSDGFALGAELRGTWRAIRNQQGQLNVIAEARHNNYPDESRADLGRVGGAVFGLLRTGFIDPGAVLGANRQWIDGEGVATILRATLTATHLSSGRSHFDSLSLDAYDVDYDDNDDATGVFTDLLWRHWWMPEAGNAKRRIEASLMGGIYSAEADSESYLTIKPGVAALWRMGDQDSGIWDVNGWTWVEIRSYDEGIAGDDAEEQTQWQIGGSLDRWFGSWFAIGPFVSYSLRESTRDGNDYDRVQVGVRALADW